MDVEKKMSFGDEKSELGSVATATSAVTVEKEGQVVMKRQIGLMGAVGIVVGTIIGSGIFISSKGVVANSHSVGLTMLIWGIGGIVSLFGALSLAELGCLIPKSAGEYVYLRRTYANWVGFLYAWNIGILVKPSSQAVVAMTCAEYMLVPVFGDGCGKPPQLYVKLLAVAVILFLAATNSISVKLSSTIQIVFMVGKLIALLIIIIGGIIRLANGHTGILATGFENTNNKPGEIIMAFYSAMFAYEGWANLVYVTEEIVNPRRNIPLTIMISIPTIIILYLMVNVSYFTVMTPEEILSSPAIAFTWAQTTIPQVNWLIPLCVAMSTFGSVNGNIFATGRIYYVLAREREMPQVLSMIHRTRKTPMPAAVFSTTFALTYLAAGEVRSLIDFLSFTTWLIIGFIQLSVIILRVKMKDAPRTYKVPIVFPAIVALFAFVLVIVPLVDAPQIEFLFAFLILILGLVFYFPIVYCDNRAGCMRYITIFFQLIMDVCPAGEDVDKSQKKGE